MAKGKGKEEVLGECTIYAKSCVLILSFFFFLECPVRTLKRQPDPLQTVESDSSDVEMVSSRALGKHKAVPSTKRRYEEEPAPEGYATQFCKLRVSIRSITARLDRISCELDEVFVEYSVVTK